ncbi:MAG TPA: hypothetical protein VIJ92_13645 [Ginsengibacter sp.]
MAGNTDKEPINNSANTQSENSSEEIIPTKDTDIINQNTESENMEVHHHPDLHHKSKKWKEYFIEFLMIFLAVSLGYLAENFREHLLNNEKELKYVENLNRDLKEEKKGITAVIIENNKTAIAIDTFVSIRKLDFSIKENNALFFKLFGDAKLWSLWVQSPNEITLNQIKATGGLNVIRPKIAELIAGLDISNQNIKRSEALFSSHSEEAFRMIYELVDYPALWDKTGNLNKNLPPLMIDDKKKLMKYFNLTLDLKYTIEGYINNLNEHLLLINSLTKTLEKEYKIKE